MTSSHQPIASDTLGGHQKLSHQVQEQKSQLWEKIPKDSDELARFEYQNRAITLVAGFRNDLIKSALVPNSDRTPTAAEFSYISGSWALDIAKEYPEVSVVGIDTVSSYPRSQPVPENCRFEEHDINLPLSKYRQAFDVCHINNMGKTINDHEDLFYRIPEVLRPNGVLLLTAGYSTLYTEDKQLVQDDLNEGEPGWSALLAIMRELRKILGKAGKPLEQQDQWEEDLQKNPYLTSVGTRDVYIPIGPWENDLSEQAEEAAKLNQTNALQFIRTISYILLQGGFDEATINRWVPIAREEVRQMKLKLYARYRIGWGVRNEVEWAPK